MRRAKPVATSRAPEVKGVPPASGAIRFRILHNDRTGAGLRLAAYLPTGSSSEPAQEANRHGRRAGYSRKAGDVLAAGA
jgi:hypothetical protein